MGNLRVNRSDLTEWDEPRVFGDLFPEFAFLASFGRDWTVDWGETALPCYEVVWVADGKLRMCFADRSLEGVAGDVFVVAPRTLHREQTPPGEFSDIICLGAAFRRASGAQRGFPLPIAEKLHLGREHPLDQHLRRIAFEADQRPPGYSLAILAHVLTVFCDLAQATQGVVAGDAVRIVNWPVPFPTQVQQYVQEHCAEPLSVSDMADHFHLSRQYFIKLFRRATGDTPHAYLTRVRMERACALLADSTLPTKAVAQQVGFDDPYYFARSFKQHTGVTPAQHRRLLADRDRGCLDPQAPAGEGGPVREQQGRQ